MRRLLENAVVESAVHEREPHRKVFRAVPFKFAPAVRQHNDLRFFSGRRLDRAREQLRHIVEVSVAVAYK